MYIPSVFLYWSQDSVQCVPRSLSPLATDQIYIDLIASAWWRNLAATAVSAFPYPSCWIRMAWQCPEKRDERWSPVSHSSWCCLLLNLGPPLRGMWKGRCDGSDDVSPHAHTTHTHNTCTFCWKLRAVRAQQLIPTFSLVAVKVWVALGSCEQWTLGISNWHFCFIVRA